MSSASPTTAGTPTGTSGRQGGRLSRVIVRRLAVFVPLMVAITFGAFALVRLAPGGPFDRERAPATPELERALRARYHLEASVAEQYLRYLGLWWEPRADGRLRRVEGGLLVGDLGPSLKYRSHGVNDIVGQALPVSMVLGGLAFLVALAVGFPLGLVGAARRGRVAGTVADSASLGVIALPAFVIGPVLVMVFSLWLGWLPAALWDTPLHAVLPVLTLGLFYAGRLARLLREGLLEVLQAPFITMARAKGLRESAVLWKHALPLASLPVLSYSGPLLADLFTGSFVVENIFQVPGVGVFLVNAVLNRDYPLVVGLVVVYAALLLVLNLLVDLAAAWLDPRIGTSPK